VKKLAKFNGLGRGGWMAVQPGLEYTPFRPVRKFMSYEEAFFPAEHPKTITEGIRIMNRYH